MSGVVRACFRKQVSDGNFGSETVEISIEDTYDTGENAEELAGLMAQEARRLVHAELVRSPSAVVRMGLAVPRPVAQTSATRNSSPVAAVHVPPDYEDEGDEIPITTGPA